MSDPKDLSHQPPVDGTLRPHVFDGIAEFNKRLPNWWLLTFYGSIAFAVGYWFYFAQSGIPPTDTVKIDQEMERIEAAKLASAPVVDDPSLWKMSRNAVFVDAGKETYNSMCASCHLPSLKGKHENPTAVGPDLTDGNWLHGGTPIAVHKTIDEGVMEKGMPAWGPVLGPKKVAEIAAYVLSFHQEGDPVTIVTSAEH